MQRLWIPLLLLLLACRAAVPASPSPTPSLAPAATPSPTQASTASPLSSATPLSLENFEASDFQVRLHPDGPLYVGDLVSLEIVAPPGAPLEGVDLAVSGPQGDVIGETTFGSYGIGRRVQATLYWAWDTTRLDPGQHTLAFTAGANERQWNETITLLPSAQRPGAEARWATAESDCCIFYYITGTDAARDLEEILDLADETAISADRLLRAGFEEPVPVVLLPRVLGHGGFASSEIAVSYLDENYTTGDLDMVLHHEMVHILDGRLGGEMRPTLLVEGLAVYLSGGHFKPEPLLPRAAALLEPAPGCLPAGDLLQNPTSEARPCALGRYLPLEPLIDDFYFSQHEISYLQAGALVEFMVDTWGWEAFNDFYRSILPADRQSAAMDSALQDSFQITLAELERRFLNRLDEQELTPELVLDVDLTVTFFDSVRRYQQLLDPSAFFLTAWLPPLEPMRERGIVADYLRRPQAAENQAAEILLIAAGNALQEGEFLYSERLLYALNAMLDPFAPPPASVRAR